jgi:hypothetical protein
MAFDYKSFTTNFLNQMSKGILERTEERKAYSDKYDEEYEEAQQVFKNRKNLLKGDIRLHMKGKYLGATDEMLFAAHSTGKGGLSSFVKAMEEQSRLKGNNKLSRSEAAALIEGEELFSKEDAEEFYERSRNLLQEEDVEAIKDDRNIFQSMLALDPKGTARARLGANKLRTIELARQDAYESLAPEGGEVFLTLEKADLDIFNPSKTLTKFIEEINKSDKAIKESSAYSTALTKSTEAAQKLIDEGRQIIVSNYVSRFGNDFLENIPSAFDNLINPRLRSQVQTTTTTGQDDNLPARETIVGKALLDAIKTDQGTMVTEQDDLGNTIKYHVAADGTILGDIKIFSHKGGEPKSYGPEYVDAIIAETNFKFEFLNKMPAFTGIKTKDIASLTEEALGQVDDPLFDPDIKVEKLGPGPGGTDRNERVKVAVDKVLKDLKEEFDAADEEGKEALVPKIKEAVQSAETVGLFESDEFKFFRDKVKEFFAGRKERLAEVRKEIADKKAAETEPVEDITVKAIEKFGGQTFSITEDNQVYINNRRTGEPETLITQKEIVDPILESVNKRTQDQLEFFFDFAREKGYVNDVDRLIAEWKRYAEKNLISEFFKNTVISEIQETFGQ